MTYTTYSIWEFSNLSTLSVVHHLRNYYKHKDVHYLMSYLGEYFTGCLTSILRQKCTLHQGDIVDNVSYMLNWSKLEANILIRSPYVYVHQIMDVT